MSFPTAAVPRRTRARHCYLRIGDDLLEQATPHPSVRDALLVFADTARSLARFDQTIAATLHFADKVDQLVEDPDRFLRLGPRGGIVVERF